MEVAQDFLRWLTRGNFVFMGVKERVLDGSFGAISLVDRPGSALGILRTTEGKSRIPLSGETLERALFPRPLYITKANSRSTVARNDYLDYIGVRRFDLNGRVIGEYVILGLFTRQAYALPAIETPLVRERIAMVRRRLGYHPGSYSDKALLGALEDYPRLELLHASATDLTDTFGGIMGPGRSAARPACSCALTGSTGLFPLWCTCLGIVTTRTCAPVSSGCSNRNLILVPSTMRCTCPPHRWRVYFSAFGSPTPTMCRRRIIKLSKSDCKKPPAPGWKQPQLLLRHGNPERQAADSHQPGQMRLAQPTEPITQ